MWGFVPVVLGDDANRLEGRAGHGRAAAGIAAGDFQVNRQPPHALADLETAAFPVAVYHLHAFALKADQLRRQFGRAAQLVPLAIAPARSSKVR